MNINHTQAQLRQISLFKDSVLSAADATRIEIIAKAQRESDETLENARTFCKLAEHDSVEQRLSASTQRKAAAQGQNARKQLFALRQKLVDDLFLQAEEKLAQFAKSPNYATWLCKKLEDAKTAFGKDEAFCVMLCPKDTALQDMVLQTCPKCSIKTDEGILLGGLKCSGKNLLFDYTLDFALKAEKENFYITSGLTL